MRKVTHTSKTALKSSQAPTGAGKCVTGCGIPHPHQKSEVLCSLAGHIILSKNTVLENQWHRNYLYHTTAKGARTCCPRTVIFLFSGSGLRSYPTFNTRAGQPVSCITHPRKAPRPAAPWPGIMGPQVVTQGFGIWHVCWWVSHFRVCPAYSKKPVSRKLTAHLRGGRRPRFSPLSEAEAPQTHWEARPVHILSWKIFF